MDKSKRCNKQRKSLFAELDKWLSNGDHERAIKICNRLLHNSPEDELAFRCKIICCINLDRISDAISFMDKNPKMLEELNFERAYCYYRFQDMKSAKEVLDKVEDSIRKRELLTQILYRMENYDEAFEACKDVIGNAGDEYDEERETNLAAINACLIGAGHTPRRRLENVLEEVDTHELRYNTACALIAEGRYQDAIKVLKEAEAKAVAILKEDGLAEEEIAQETAIITIQSGYCAQQLGREKEALGLYYKVLKNKPPEVELVSVASNNILCINRDQKLFDSKRRVNAMRADGTDAKLTRAQRRTMQINQGLFYLHTGQVELCKEIISAAESKFPEAEHELFLIKTALVLKTDGIESAKQFVAPKIAKDKDKSSLTINLCLVQQLLRDGKRTQAISILETLGRLSFQPGILGALVTLHHNDGRIGDAAAALKQAVDFYRKGEGNKRQLNMLWRQAVSLMIQQGDLAEAVKSLEELRKSDPDDITTLAQLIVAYAQYDIKKAHQLSSQLPALPPPDELDMAALDSPNWQSNVKLLRKQTKSECSVSSTTRPVSSNVSVAESSSGDQKKKKKKLKCKSKLPKGFVDPERKPDPERWLPKYERTGYKPRRGRGGGKVDVGKGPQGVDSKNSIYDMSAKVVKNK